MIHMYQVLLVPRVAAEGYHIGARRRRDRDCLRVLLICVVLFRVAAAVNFLTHLLVAAAPVVVPAGGITISGKAPHTSRRVVGQWRGAGGAICEDHFAFCGELFGFARRL